MHWWKKPETIQSNITVRILHSDWSNMLSHKANLLSLGLPLSFSLTYLRIVEQIKLDRVMASSVLSTSWTKVHVKNIIQGRKLVSGHFH